MLCVLLSIRCVNPGNENVMVTERGTTFGYQDLVVDYRGIKIMQQECQCPVVVDVTHSLQQPNQSCGVTGGQPQLIETIAKAGIAVGADGIFIETHPDPKKMRNRTVRICCVWICSKDCWRNWFGSGKRYERIWENNFRLDRIFRNRSEPEK